MTLKERSDVMKKTQLKAAIMTVILACCLTACDKKDTPQTIPAVNETTLAQAVQTLGTSEETFNEFLSTMGLSFDDYITALNNNNTSLDDMKTEIESTYNCTFDEYAKTILIVGNKTLPDESKYVIFKSQYSLYDAYIPLSELNTDKTELKNYDIEVFVADEDEDAYAFDAIVACQGDFKSYIDTLHSNYDCTSAELTNVSIFGSYGVKKPEEKNACIDNMMFYDGDTNEILEKIAVPVITLHNQDESKNMTLALSNELGLIFKTTGADSYDKMLNLSDIDFQIRTAALNTNNDTDADE